MADGQDPAVVKGVKDLEEEITCAICHEHYTEPKVLPCCHYYCKQCLHQLALRKGIDKPLSCPECRKDTTLPEGGLDSLPTAFFVNRMKEVHSKLELAHGKVEAKCEMCSEDKAEAFCRQCAKFICADCARSHVKQKQLFPGHMVSTIDELREGVAKDIITAEPSFQSCRVHKQPMNVYCYDCKSLICRDCTVKLHRDHHFEFVIVAAPDIRQELLLQLNPLRESCSNMLCAVGNIQTTISGMEDQGKSVIKQIGSSFAEFRKIIDDHEQELLTETAMKVEQKCKHLSEQEKGLSLACAATKSVIDYTEHCVEHSADDQIMCLRTEVRSRINREIEDQPKDLEPVEEVDIGFEVNCAEDLKQLLQTKAELTRLPVDVAKSSIIGEGVGSAEVNKLSRYHFQLFPKLPNGRPTKQSSVVTCGLKSLLNGSAVECQVEPIEGKYRIQYTPTVRGRHELTVTVNGQEVAGSPFPVFVSIHPTLLGKPVRVITGIENPSSVAVASEGRILISHGKDVAIYDKNGEYLGEYEDNSNCKFAVAEFTFVVAEGTDGGCVYLSNGPKILQVSPDLTVAAEFSGKSELQHFRMAIVGDELMVRDRSNNVVMVYTKDLKYVRTLDGQGHFGSIRCMSSDENQNLYVTDYEKGCVHVFSESGEFLHAFGQGDRDGMKKPLGVCVVGQYVYVTEKGNHCVSVFTTKGERVTSFGQYGSDEGDFNVPRGVCVDKDGVVYVCDNYNERVQIF